MEKLRLTKKEEKKFLETLQKKFTKECNSNINEFSFTKPDVDAFLKEMNNGKEITKPTLNIPADIYAAMYELVKQSPVEISWHGLVKRDTKKNTYCIYDLIMFPQINTPTSTTTDEDEFAAWQTELIKDENFPIEDLRMHGHSHVNMKVFSSAVDDKYQQDLIRKVEDGDYYIFLILNKKMEMCAFIYDFTQQIRFDTDNVTIQILNKEDGDIKSWVTEAIKRYCKQPSATSTLWASKWESEVPTVHQVIKENKFPGRY